jgi:hypothetical protein
MWALIFLRASALGEWCWKTLTKVRRLKGLEGTALAVAARAAQENETLDSFRHAWTSDFLGLGTFIIDSQLRFFFYTFNCPEPFPPNIGIVTPQ